MKTKYIYILLLSLLPCVTEAQELTVQSFSLSPSELISTADQRKDLNGTACALVKVQVVDDIVRAEGNVIGGIVNRGTEKWVYLTQGTKTFRIFPKNHLPLTISTGDFQIDELEGKRVYILRLTASGSSAEVVQQKSEIIQQQPEPEPVVQPEPEVVQQQQEPEPAYQEYYTPEAPATPVKSSYSAESPLHFYGGIGFNALSVMGPSVHLGLRYKSVALEGGFVYGLDKVKNVLFSIQSSSVSERYDYSCSKIWARLGVNFDSGQFQISPQAGVTFNMISGKAASSIYNNTTDYFKDSNPMSLFAALRLSYEVADHLRIHLTPQYDFTLGGDQVYEVIKQGDSKLKAWAEGFGVNVGIIYEF